MCPRGICLRETLAGLTPLLSFLTALWPKGSCHPSLPVCSVLAWSSWPHSTEREENQSVNVVSYISSFSLTQFFLKGCFLNPGMLLGRESSLQ